MDRYGNSFPIVPVLPQGSGNSGNSAREVEKIQQTSKQGFGPEKKFSRKSGSTDLIPGAARIRKQVEIPSFPGVEGDHRDSSSPE